MRIFGRYFLECCSIGHKYQRKQLSLTIKRLKLHKRLIKLSHSSAQTSQGIYFTMMTITNIIMSKYSMSTIKATGKRRQSGKLVGKKSGKIFSLHGLRSNSFADLASIFHLIFNLIIIGKPQKVIRKFGFPIGLRPSTLQLRILKFQHGNRQVIRFMIGFFFCLFLEFVCVMNTHFLKFLMSGNDFGMWFEFQYSASEK